MTASVQHDLEANRKSLLRQGAKSALQYASSIHNKHIIVIMKRVKKIAVRRYTWQIVEFNYRVKKIFVNKNLFCCTMATSDEHAQILLDWQLPRAVVTKVLRSSSQASLHFILHKEFYFGLHMRLCFIAVFKPHLAPHFCHLSCQITFFIFINHICYKTHNLHFYISKWFRKIQLFIIKSSNKISGRWVHWIIKIISSTSKCLI